MAFQFQSVGALSPLIIEGYGVSLTDIGLLIGVPPPEVRAFGMGVYYAIYYAWMMVAPTLAGAIADRVGSAGVVLIIGALILVPALVALGLLRRNGLAPQTA